jgi:hypothetical protein
MENASVSQDGQEATARNKFAQTTVIPAEYAKTGDVYVTHNGKVTTAVSNDARRTVSTEGSVSMEPVTVSQGLKGNTVKKNHVSMTVLIMVYVKIMPAFAMKTTSVLIAQ